MWVKWAESPPKPGDKIIIVHDDGCSATIGLVIDWDGNGSIDVLHAEDGMSLLRYPGHETPNAFGKCLWSALPDDYTIAFTQETDADWL